MKGPQTKSVHGVTSAPTDCYAVTRPLGITQSRIKMQQKTREIN